MSASIRTSEAMVIASSTCRDPKANLSSNASSRSGRNAFRFETTLELETVPQEDYAEYKPVAWPP